MANILIVDDEKEIADNILHFLVNGLKRKEVEKDAE